MARCHNLLVLIAYNDRAIQEVRDIFNNAKNKIVYTLPHGKLKGRPWELLHIANFGIDVVDTL